MPSLALIGPIGNMEALIILAVALLIFGRRLPEVGRSLGKGIVEFRRGLSGVSTEIDEAAKQPERPLPEAARPPVNSAGEDARVSRAPAVHGDSAAG
ncbi:MAG: twin-arginine translocase TatA/TatE family subunit [Phycisphaerae bacterium]|nr:twin-arginine translocase TatA/TatE family subunit [Phycisphaerae bacterium]